MKKRFSVYLLMVLIGFLPVIIFPRDLTITKVGEWGTGYYYDLFIQGQYIYIAAGKGGLDIIDISDPLKPKKVGNHDTPGIANALYVNGHYAYAADWEGGLQIFDVSDPFSPVLAGGYKPPGYVGDIYVNGSYAYAACYDSGLHIVDVSEPSNPTLIGEYDTTGHARGVHVVGNYAYVADGYEGLKIIDVTNPSSPVPVGSYDTPGYSRRVTVIGNYSYIADNDGGLQIIDITDPSAPILANNITTSGWVKDVFVNGNYAFVADYEWGLRVIDISKPSEPAQIGNYDTSGNAFGVSVNDNLAYVADYDYGLQVLDVSEPSSLTVVGSYDNTLDASGVDVKGNHAYVADYSGVLHIVDISNNSSPTQVEKCVFPETYRFSGMARAVHVRGNYAYVAAWDNSLLIIDVSNPTTPNIVGTGATVGLAVDIFVSGNYAYVACSCCLGYGALSVIDVSNPSASNIVGNCYTQGFMAYGVYVVGNYAYVADAEEGLSVIDVSNPSAPNIVGNCNTPGMAKGVYVIGNYAYLADDEEGLQVIDVSNPSTPTIAGNYDTSGNALGVYVADGYAYVADDNKGLQVIDVSDPSAPTLVGSYDTPGSANDVYVRDNYVYVAERDNGKLIILNIDKSSASPRIRLNRSQLNFASDHSGVVTPVQSLFITNSGGGTLNWSVNTDQHWLNGSPSSGLNSGKVLVSVTTTGLSVGTYTGTISISDSNASNSPKNVKVTLNVYSPGHTLVPFGVFTTPIDGSTVRSSVPFTGWVLDDIGVQSVQLFREDGNSLVYIGDAVFVEGARPDVEQAYPGYPNNYKAGWGYMMLTNFLPNGGNGTFKIHAIAADLEGNQVTLGTKTMVCDNANAVKPFGAIDTPAQGGAASGSDFVNFGWALTPLPNMIPIDGSTIQVWVDSVPLGNPVYNQYREDIATLFPNYNNSNGAVGYFYLDTTQYENGVHTIAWSVKDDAGNSDGIGSRYFTIQNTGASSVVSSGVSGQWSVVSGKRNLSEIPIDYLEPVEVIKGFNRNVIPSKSYPNEKGIITIETRELERFEVRLFPVGAVGLAPLLVCSGFHIVGSQLRPLPIGSTLDRERGIFSWLPGPGYLGKYRLVFIEEDEQKNKRRKEVLVTIRPKFFMLREYD